MLVLTFLRVLNQHHFTVTSSDLANLETETPKSSLGPWRLSAVNWQYKDDGGASSSWNTLLVRSTGTWTMSRFILPHWNPVQLQGPCSEFSEQVETYYLFIIKRGEAWPQREICTTLQSIKRSTTLTDHFRSLDFRQSFFLI